MITSIKLVLNDNFDKHANFKMAYSLSKNYLPTPVRILCVVICSSIKAAEGLKRP